VQSVEREVGCIVVADGFSEEEDGFGFNGGEGRSQKKWVEKFSGCEGEKGKGESFSAGGIGCKEEDQMNLMIDIIGSS